MTGFGGSLTGDLFLDIVIYVVVTLAVIIGLLRGRADHNIRPADVTRTKHLSSSFDNVRDGGGIVGNTKTTPTEKRKRINIPMSAQTVDVMRVFYLDLLKLVEIPHPDDTSADNGFWAISGGRQVHVQISPVPARADLPVFICPDIDDCAIRLQDAGYMAVWDDSLPYVRRFRVTDPAGNQIIAVGA